MPAEERVKRDLVLCRKLRRELLHLIRRQRLKRLGDRYIAFDVRHLRHPDHRRRHRQRHRVANQFLRRRLSRNRVLREDLHRRDAHLLAQRHRQRHGLKTRLGVFHLRPHRRVQRHLRAIEFVTLQRHFQHLRIGVAAHADEARHLLFLRLHRRLVRAALRRDRRQILRTHQRVDVQQIHMIHLQAFQADIQNAHELVVLARTHFARQPQPRAPARLQHLPDPQLALAVLAVAVAGIDVRDAQVERVAERSQPLLFAIAYEAAAAAECQRGDLRARLAQRAHGHAGGGNQRSRHRSQCGRSNEIATSDAHVWKPITLRRPMLRAYAAGLCCGPMFH